MIPARRDAMTLAWVSMTLQELMTSLVSALAVQVLQLSGFGEHIRKNPETYPLLSSAYRACPSLLQDVTVMRGLVKSSPMCACDKQSQAEKSMMSACPVSPLARRDLSLHYTNTK
jgi:hypothetical protein